MRFVSTNLFSSLNVHLCKNIFYFVPSLQGAICLAKSLKVVNEALTSLNLGFNEIRVCSFQSSKFQSQECCFFQHIYQLLSQDEGAFAIAQALKANEDVRLTSVNLSNNFFTKLGQVKFQPLSYWIQQFQMIQLITQLDFLNIMQTALSDAKDHVYEMTERELNVLF